MAAKKRNTGVLQIFQQETIINEMGDQVEVMVPVKLDHPENITQVAQMERWINQAVKNDNSGLPDGKYIIIRVMKTFEIGTTRAATFSDLMDDTEDPEENEAKSESSITNGVSSKDKPTPAKTGFVGKPPAAPAITPEPTPEVVE